MDPGGVVRAGDGLGMATVIGTMEETIGVTQSLALLVEVKMIQYLQLSAGAFMSVAPSDAVPVGSSLGVAVTYHDNRSRTFTAVRASSRFRLSRFDLVDVRRDATNHSLTVALRGVGLTLLQVWLQENPTVQGV